MSDITLTHGSKVLGGRTMVGAEQDRSDGANIESPVELCC